MSISKGSPPASRHGVGLPLCAVVRGGTPASDPTSSSILRLRCVRGLTLAASSAASVAPLDPAPNRPLRRSLTSSSILCLRGLTLAASSTTSGAPLPVPPLPVRRPKTPAIPSSKGSGGPTNRPLASRLCPGGVPLNRSLALRAAETILSLPRPKAPGISLALAAAALTPPGPIQSGNLP